MIFVSWYYPIGLSGNAAEANQGIERQGLMFLFVLAFVNFAGTFVGMVMAAVDSVEAAGNVTNLLHSLSLIFCGYVYSHFPARIFSDMKSLTDNFAASW